MIKLRILLFVSLLGAPVARSQQPLPDLSQDGKGRSGYSTKWDLSAGELIYFRNIEDRSMPAVRIVSGEKGSIPIRPLEDLPGARGVNVWDVAETPEGGVVLSVIVLYGPPTEKPSGLKSLVLTYDRAGRLTRFWDVYPYHHLKIAVDRRGNVFGLGLKRTSSSDYPLLIKYSRDGKVVGEFLPASQFPMGDDAVLSGSRNGEPAMFIHGDELVLWLAPAQELLRLSLEGAVLARSSIQGALESLAAQCGSKRAMLGQISARPNGAIIAQFQCSLSADWSIGLRVAMASISDDGTSATLISPLVDSNTGDHFLGIAPDGQLVFIARDGQSGQMMIVRRH